MFQCGTRACRVPTPRQSIPTASATRISRFHLLATLQPQLHRHEDRPEELQFNPGTGLPSKHILYPWSQTRTVPIIDPTAPRQRKKQATPNMPPRKSTSSVTAADPDDASLLSPVAPTSDKPITATEQQIKARAELGVSVDVSIPTLHSLLVFPQSA